MCDNDVCGLYATQIVILVPADGANAAADATLPTLPPTHLVRFGTITASKNAVLRLEIEEVELLSESWLVQGFQIPVCGEAPYRSLMLCICMYVWIGTCTPAGPH